MVNSLEYIHVFRANFEYKCFLRGAIKRVFIVLIYNLDLKNVKKYGGQ